MPWAGRTEEAERDLARVLVAMVEAIQWALDLEAELRIEGGGLSVEQVGRLRRVIGEMDRAVEQVKAEAGVWAPGEPWGAASHVAAPLWGSGRGPRTS